MSWKFGADANPFCQRDPRALCPGPARANQPASRRRARKQIPRLPTDLAPGRHSSLIDIPNAADMNISAASTCERSPLDKRPRPLTHQELLHETEAGTAFEVFSRSPGGRPGAAAQTPRLPDQRGSARCRRRSWPRPRQAHCRLRAAPRSQPTCRSRPAGAPRRHSTAPPKRRRPHPGVACKLRRPGRARPRAPRHHGRPRRPIPRAPVRIDLPAPATSDDQRPTPAHRRTPIASDDQRYGAVRKRNRRRDARRRHGRLLARRTRSACIASGSLGGRPDEPAYVTGTRPTRPGTR
jgi:hypothetical protein